MAVVYSASAVGVASSSSSGLNPRVIKKSASINRNRPSMVIMMSSSSSSSSSSSAADNQISVNTKLQIRLPSTSRNKIFEDPSEGIVCYRDENGVITCEGIDEGPRFCHRSSLFPSSNYRETEIIDLLRTCSSQMIEDLRFIN